MTRVLTSERNLVSFHLSSDPGSSLLTTFFLPRWRFAPIKGWSSAISSMRAVIHTPFAIRCAPAQCMAARSLRPASSTLVTCLTSTSIRLPEQAAGRQTVSVSATQGPASLPASSRRHCLSSLWSVILNTASANRSAYAAPKRPFLLTTTVDWV